MSGTLLRGGRVIDGSGAPEVVADVRVCDGLIVEVGRGLRPDGEMVLDASGAVVTPGFIDNHTHVDPSLFWEGSGDPLPQHGVTTALMGNCSLSLAPVRAGDRDAVTRLFCYIEDLPVAAFDAAIPWSWETYSEYAAVMRHGAWGLDAMGFVGHTPLRLWVLGEQAWERTATADEIAVMVALLSDSLKSGAIGMSTSLGFDEDPDKRPVPSRLAADDELDALFAVLAAHGAMLQFIPTQGGGKLMTSDVARVAQLSRRHDLASTWIGVFHNAQKPASAVKHLDDTRVWQNNGVRMYPQVSPRTVDFRVNWFGGMSFSSLTETWHPMIQAGTEDKRRMLADPAWRERARAEWDSTRYTLIPHHFPDRIRLLSAAAGANQNWIGRSLAELAAARDQHVSDALAQWVLENELSPQVIGVGIFNSDADGVAETLVHPAALLGNSDAGAHLQMLCAYGDSTLLLTRHVRERRDLSLERAVQMLTGRQADVFGLLDRGIIEVGRRADLVVFDPDALHWDDDVFVPDLPAGGVRLTRPPGGYRLTIVNGTVTQTEGELTGARPGRFGRPTDGPARLS